MKRMLAGSLAAVVVLHRRGRDERVLADRQRDRDEGREVASRKGAVSSFAPWLNIPTPTRSNPGSCALRLPGTDTPVSHYGPGTAGSPRRRVSKCGGLPDAIRVVPRARLLPAEAG